MGVPSVKVHGGWGEWSEYGDCSQTCGHGIKTRGRHCNSPEPEHGGNSCPGIPVENADCKIEDCPVHGAWGAWSDYGACTVTCGGGQHTRSRECGSPRPRHGGDQCPALDIGSTHSSACNQEACPVHGGWSAWSAYPDCPVTCGGGFLTRTRECGSPAPEHGGDPCAGEFMETSACNNITCPVHGRWGAWSAYSDCSKSCGSGLKGRKRACDSPPPKHGGDRCPGETEELTACNDKKCPVNGGWGEWSEYGACSMTCGGGTRRRERDCDSPAPQHGGDNCSVGNVRDEDDCNDQPCPVNGGWSAWSTSACSVTCRIGQKDYTRKCDSPRPQHGGTACPGSSSFGILVQCGDKYCPGDMSKARVCLQTGSVHNAGTDGHVHVWVEGQSGHEKLESNQWTELDSENDDFERGTHFCYDVKLKYVGQINYIWIKMTDTTSWLERFDAWHLDHVTVQYYGTEWQYKGHFNQWFCDSQYKRFANRVKKGII